MPLDKALQQKILSAFTPQPAVGKIAVAVSGGCDSVAMLLLLRDWCRMRGVELCVFHVDHGMRTNSAADAQWVSDLANRLGIQCFMRRAVAEDRNTGENPHSEAWARNFRYSAFAGMLAESGAGAVATGHTADDQAETVMMRLLRGCSWQGLKGIGSRVRLRFAGCTVAVWRPMLKTTRAELEDYLRHAGQTWREDETNQSGQYFRNRVRHQLLPLMNNMQSGATRHLRALGEDALLIQRGISRLARRYIQDFGSPQSLTVYITPECTLRLEILRRWLTSAGLCDRVVRPLIVRVDNLWKKQLPGRRVVYKGFLIKRSGDQLIFEKIYSKWTLEDLPESMSGARSDFSVGDQTMSLVESVAVELAGWTFILSQTRAVPDERTEVFRLLPEHVGSLQVRYRQPGDRFYPRGGTGGKKLARWLINQKVPVELRDKIPLVVSEDKILLIPGLGRSSFLLPETETEASAGWWLSVTAPGK